MKVLYIEDEPTIGKHIKKALSRIGFAVDWAENGKSGSRLLNTYEYDCLILDLNLPDIDGLSIARKIRESGNNLPILMLTARSTKPEVLEGFTAGTDDYLNKPFDFDELVARINSLIRRSQPNGNAIIEVRNLKFNSITKKSFVENVEVILTNKELGILEYMLNNRGRYVSQEEFLEHVWDKEADVFTDTVRTNIKTLRQKIDPQKKIIFTLRGRGYAIK